jgi:hypothetical protein
VATDGNSLICDCVINPCAIVTGSRVGIGLIWSAHEPSQGEMQTPSPGYQANSAIQAAHIAHVDVRIRSALQQVGSLLTPGELLQAHAVQEPLYAYMCLGRRVLIAITTGRVIVLHRKLFGGYSMSDVQWQDLRDARISEGALGAHLCFTTTRGAFEVKGVNKMQARALYVVCQQQEQVWREKNRVRDMEAHRAHHVPQLAAVHGGSPQPMGANPMARIGQAKAMLDQGLISQVDFEAIKAKAIAQM